ncbi:MAG TPA: hypothetical protein VG826_14200 [Pirellulales bacterium]|nr:hypothetical protein [Pirellulales bacterium]
MRRFAGYSLIFLVAVAMVTGLFRGLLLTCAGEMVEIDDLTGRTIATTYVWKNGLGLTVSHLEGELPRMTVESGLDVSWLDEFPLPSSL